MKVKVLVIQSFPNLCDPMDCSTPGSSVYEIFKARILECTAIPFSRGSFGPRDQIWVSCTAGGFFAIWATRKISIIVLQIVRKHLTRGFLCAILDLAGTLWPLLIPDYSGITRRGTPFLGLRNPGISHYSDKHPLSFYELCGKRWLFATLSLIGIVLCFVSLEFFYLCWE